MGVVPDEFLSGKYKVSVYYSDNSNCIGIFIFIRVVIMEHMFRLLIGFGIVFIATIIYRALRPYWRNKHASDVDLIWKNSPKTPQGFYSFSIFVPTPPRVSPDEFKNYEVGQRNVLKILTEILCNNLLVQIMVSDHFFPNREFVYDLGIRSFKQGIKHLPENALVYTPETIKKGVLKNGLVEGTNGFLIYSGDNPSYSTDLATLLSKQDELLDEESIHLIIESLGIDGFIEQNGRAITLHHKDKEFIEQFVNRMLDLVYRKLFAINELIYPSTTNFPLYAELFSDLSTEEDTHGVGAVYFDDKDVVTFLGESSDLKNSVTHIKLDEESKITDRLFSWIGRWCVPRIIPNRVYRRKSCFRYSFQYLCTTFYTMGVVSMLIYVSEAYLANVPDIWFSLPCVILGFLSVLSLIVSIMYFLRALFGGKRLIRPGI